MKDYEQMLDEFYEKLPKKTFIKERFDPPMFSAGIQGTQTFIQNFDVVASALRRKPDHLFKYISKDLATAGSIQGKRAMLQGKFKEDLVNSKLKNYIDEFVLCNECKRPDTNLITIERCPYKQCESCGARAPVKHI